MPAFAVHTPAQTYEAKVERGALAQVGGHVPAKAGKVFVVTTEDVWRHHGSTLTTGMGGRSFELLFFPGGESRKRFSEVESLAEQMVARGGDRASVVVAFGGGIVNDLGGFLAAIFMRGIPVIQIPTTLLAQVDAAVGGKTAANLVSGKNLIGAFHQPLVCLIDPDVLATLPEREYLAGLAEVIKAGIIRSEGLFRLLYDQHEAVRARQPEVVEQCIADAVRIKCEVVSADEKESGLRRILNFGHTIGHTFEAESGYTRFLHGEAVALGMIAAIHLSVMTGYLPEKESLDMLECIRRYGPWPIAAGLEPERLLARLSHDKKTIKGTVHFVLTPKIGATEVVSGIDERVVLEAIRKTVE
jgi:3-dehydroquinate synthase